MCFRLAFKLVLGHGRPGPWVSDRVWFFTATTKNKRNTQRRWNLKSIEMYLRIKRAHPQTCLSIYGALLSNGEVPFRSVSFLPPYRPLLLSFYCRLPSKVPCLKMRTLLSSHPHTNTLHSLWMTDWVSETENPFCHLSILLGPISIQFYVDWKE